MTDKIEVNFMLDMDHDNKRLVELLSDEKRELRQDGTVHEYTTVSDSICYIKLSHVPRVGDKVYLSSDIPDLDRRMWEETVTVTRVTWDIDDNGIEQVWVDVV